MRLLLRSFKAKYKSIDKVYSYFCYSEEFSEKIGVFEYFQWPDHNDACHMVNERPYAN